MKLKFLRPKDQIKLLVDGTLETTLKSSKDNYYAEELKKKGIVEIPKGSVLQVSQIYLRNRGWFSDSITFKIPKNSMVFDKFVDAEVKRTLKYQSESLKEYKSKLNWLKKNNAQSGFISYDNVKGLSTAKTFTKEFTHDELVTEAFKLSGSCQTFTVSRLMKDIDRIQANIDSLNNKSKGCFGHVRQSVGNSVIRILLPDIEAWDVEII